MTELKPCPFCGSKVEISERNGLQGDIEYRIWCTGCLMRYSKSDWANGYEKSKIIEEWNRRVNE